MDEVKNGVETNLQSAPTVAESDPENSITELLDQLKQAESERDNYKAGMLAAKGKLPEAEANVDLTDPNQLADFVERRVAQKLATTREAEVRKNLESVVKQQARELKEAKLALANKANMSSSGTGSGESNLTSKAGYLSADQVADLKKRGWDDKKIARFVENDAKRKA